MSRRDEHTHDLHIVINDKMNNILQAIHNSRHGYGRASYSDTVRMVLWYGIRYIELYGVGKSKRAVASAKAEDEENTAELERQMEEMIHIAGL
jgi:hypothetical protein